MGGDLPWLHAAHRGHSCLCCGARQRAAAGLQLLLLLLLSLVLTPLPLPSCRCPAAAAWVPGGWVLLPQIVSEDAVASEVLEADEFDAATQDSLHYARTLVTQAVDAAAAEVGCGQGCWVVGWWNEKCWRVAHRNKAGLGPGRAAAAVWHPQQASVVVLPPPAGGGSLTIKMPGPAACPALPYCLPGCTYAGGQEPHLLQGAGA